jgi:integrase/recombinase XerD
MRRLADRADLPTPSIHSFRRYFALEMLRSGVDVFSLQLLMGHADIQVLRRYLKQTNNDTFEAHLKGSPVDKYKI